MSFMSALKVNSNSLFFRDRLPTLTLAITIDQIFTIINENQYCNHFNYQLLEAIVKKFGNRGIRNKLEDYIDSVISFENTVSLSEYTVRVPKSLSIPDILIASPSSISISFPLCYSQANRKPDNYVGIVSYVC